MFTWICPKCGSEVSPSHSECPNCARNPKVEEPVKVVETVPPPPLPPSALPPPVLPPPSAPVQTATRPGNQMSPWVAGAASAGSILAVLGVLYLWVLPARSKAPVKSEVSLEAPAARPVGSNPLTKLVEVGGVRITSAPAGKAKIQFLVVNHSPANLPELKMQIEIRARSGEAVVGFPANVPSLGPYQSQEMSVSVKTALKPYELPDWQAVQADFKITEP